LLLELERCLRQRGRCTNPDDVFFLTVDELRSDFLFDPNTDLRAVIATRRAEYDRNQKLQPPPVLFGHGDPAQWQPETIVANSDRLEGLPVSPGLAIGRARVILQVTPQDRVLPGEILVAPLTDPGWSPYFLTAAAIVSDLGGLLSHGSIVAREYGLPAVTNVGTATRIIHTGDLVQVDGNRGTVTILERAAQD
jgi:pyruvate,water dikinase